ncbi:polycomb protein Asx-like isoform X2 [Macrosteles quadrilineatus]|uniref:polycomb protein Asx-like isoform X2 n=1 Tax=Macrosteles quadrilineatus TaxID=74068 RepID=UPI0023E171B7|nr:polycomb protein Asx-like isoform X2 [Macrosteles quadrilineatus]
MDDNKVPVCNNKVSKSAQALSPVKLHKVKGSYGQVESGGEGEGEPPVGGEGVWSITRQEDNPPPSSTSTFKELRISQSHSKKVIKHALRQQAKRRRKNTTIAAGNSTPLPRIIMPPQSELEETTSRTNYRPPTMMEVLSSIPGFSIKQRKRSNKKLSAAAQLEQTKEGCIDLETPDSILVNTNLRSLLNKHTFNQLPALYQYKLVQLLPHVDRTTPAGDSFRLSASGLNNEFFARACLEWRERLAEGEFTPEHQQKLKTEAEREKSKLDPWKLKHFEPIWGESSMENPRIEWTPPPKVVPKPKPTPKTKTPPTPPPPRLRTVGPLTRAVANYREKREAEENSLLEPSKRIKSSKIAEPAAIISTETISSEPSISPRCKTRDSSRRNEEVKSSSEEVREELDTGKEEWKEESVCQEEVKDEVDNSKKCTELEITDWENVEVISVDPVQEYVDVNTQVEKECNQINESDKFVCDISASEEVQEDSVVKEEVKEVTQGENKMEEERGVEEESQNVEDKEESNEFVTVESDNGDNAVQSDSPVDPQYEISEKYDVVNTIAVEDIMDDNLFVQQYRHTIEDENASKSIENEPGDSEISQDTTQNDTCDKPNDKDECLNNLKEEELKEEALSVYSSECIKEDSNIFLQKESENYSQESALEHQSIRNENEEMSLSSNNAENVTGEEITNNKLVDTVEENVNTRRFDIDMADIQDHLEFVSQETSLHTPSVMESNQESSHQDSMDSQMDVKDSGSYSVKMEDVDQQDSTSNLPSLDSQETRQEEETSQAGHLTLPEPEVPTTVAAEETTDMEASGGVMQNDQFSMYNTNTLLYHDPLKEEEVEAAALFAAAWGAVDSSTEKLLAQVTLPEESEVNVIPMQEELEVRLEEIKSVPGWSSYPHDTRAMTPLTQTNPGHVKLELEVTLTPEVDSQVSSTVEGGGVASGSRVSAPTDDTLPKTTAAPVNVIPPTTFVCLPSINPVTSAPPHQPPPQGVVSSSAVPYLALTTTTAVRALPTKPKPSSGGSGGRSSRNVSSKPPPGAVNLERSYQICQAVIQNSPNRDQLRCQLKPPPSLLIGKTDKTQYSVVTSSRGAKALAGKQRTYQQRPTAPVLVKHVFTSSQGIPVTMAVLPHTQPANNPEVAESQMGHYVLVQRTGAQVRRSNSAPPSNNENMVGVGGRGRPASVGEGGGGDSPTPGCYPNKHSVRSADCHCSLKAMIACKKCGAFCHDDCIDPSRVCVTCLIR